MIRVACPSCRAQFDVAENFAGRAAKCTNCGGPIQIPSAPPSVAAGPWGTPPAVPGAPAVSTGQPIKSSGVSIAGFVCGLVAFILSLLEIIPCIGCFVLFVTVPTSLAGLICSIIGLVTAKKANRKKGLAIAGLALSIVAILFPIVFFLVFAVLGSLGGSTPHMLRGLRF